MIKNRWYKVTARRERGTPPILITYALAPSKTLAILNALPMYSRVTLIVTAAPTRMVSCRVCGGPVRRPTPAECECL
jgi:hypothetical protein